MALAYIQLFPKLIDDLSYCTDEQVGRLVRGMMAYMTTGQDYARDMPESILWPVCRASVDASVKALEDKRRAGATKKSTEQAGTEASRTEQKPAEPSRPEQTGAEASRTDQSTNYNIQITDKENKKNKERGNKLQETPAEESDITRARARACARRRAREEQDQIQDEQDQIQDDTVSVEALANDRQEAEAPDLAILQAISMSSANEEQERGGEANGNEPARIEGQDCQKQHLPDQEEAPEADQDGGNEFLLRVQEEQGTDGLAITSSRPRGMAGRKAAPISKKTENRRETSIASAVRRPSTTACNPLRSSCFAISVPEDQPGEDRPEGCSHDLETILPGRNPGHMEDVENHRYAERSGGAPDHAIRYQYGTFGRVYLSVEELELLRVRYPESWEAKIANLDAYLQYRQDKQYDNHLAVIFRWAAKDEEKVRGANPSLSAANTQHGKIVREQIYDQRPNDYSDGTGVPAWVAELTTHNVNTEFSHTKAEFSVEARTQA